MTTGRLTFWITLFAIAWILGSLHAAWWQITVLIVTVWLVRYTALYEFTDGVP